MDNLHDSNKSMTTQTEALKLALEALESSRIFVTSREKIKHPEGTDWYDERIAAIKEALVQSEQEPVAYIHRNEYNEYRLEPHDNFDIKSIPFNVDVSLFKSPQRKPWVSLSDEDIERIAKKARSKDHAITLGMRELKEKNT